MLRGRGYKPFGGGAQVRGPDMEEAELGGARGGLRKMMKIYRARDPEETAEWRVSFLKTALGGLACVVARAAPMSRRTTSFALVGRLCGSLRSLGYSVAPFVRSTERAGSRDVLRDRRRVSYLHIQQRGRTSTVALLRSGLTASW